VVFHSVFPAHEVEREKQVVLDEINTYRDIPQEMLYDRFEELMFAGSPLGRNILGTARSVKRFDSEKIRNFISRTWTPDQMVFSAIGNISETAFVKCAERYLGCVSAIGRGFERVVPPAYVPFDEVHKNGNHQAHCIVGNRAYNLADSRRLPLTLLVNILGGPAANSRLNTVLRERNGLSYNIEAGFSHLSDSGFAGVYFSCEKENMERCRELVGVELQRVMNVPLTPRQLSTAKKQFIGQFSVSMESNEGYMLGAAKSFLASGEIDSPQTVACKVNAITSDEIMEVAREVFVNTSAVIYR
jgi:predicted Zn-dependent peptidase